MKSVSPPVAEVSVQGRIPVGQGRSALLLSTAPSLRKVDLESAPIGYAALRPGRFSHKGLES
jgi:hypothetical protein